MIHLDTSFIVDLLREARRRKPGTATAFLDRVSDEEVKVSVFAICELLAGARRANSPAEERARVRRFCDTLQISYPDDRFAETYAVVLDGLFTQRLNVDTMDLLIAISALVDGARLVTGNVRHFSHIVELEVVSHT